MIIYDCLCLLVPENKRNWKSTYSVGYKNFSMKSKLIWPVTSVEMYIKIIIQRNVYMYVKIKHSEKHLHPEV